MPGQDRFWKIAAISLIVALFFIGSGLRNRNPIPIAPLFEQTASAQVVAPGITADSLETIITQSPDGRELFVWSFEKWDHDHNRLPVFLGVVAVE